MYKLFGLITFLCLSNISESWGQDLDSIAFNNKVLPIAFYLPETSLGLGLTGISTFRRHSESAALRPSQFLYSVVYTFKNQVLLFLPYELYSQANRRRIKGELGYYRYFYNYYGIGGQSKVEDLEIYSVNFPRFDLSYAITPDRLWYFGGGFKFDYFDITKRESKGFLETDQPTGYQGGIKANLQLLIVRDNRDNIISSKKGSYLEINFEHNLPDLLSDFYYHKGTIDYRFFTELRPGWVLATRINSSHASAGTPFFDLVYISSPKLARGFTDRRFIARNITTAQTELRYPIIKKLTGVVFSSPNLIYNGGPFDFNKATIKVSYGLGLRYELDKNERTKIRLDVASGAGQMNVYLTMNEAF